MTLLCAERVTRGVTRAAMREPFDQVRTAIPPRVFRWVRLIDAGSEIERFPQCDRWSQTRGELEPIRRNLGAHRLARHDKGVNRRDVLVADAREVIVRKGGIQVLPSPVDTLAHGAQEIGFGPAADPRIQVRCDVGGVDRAERRRQRQSTGKGAAVTARVTGNAVADRGKLRALGHQRWIERRRRGKVQVDRSSRRDSEQEHRAGERYSCIHITAPNRGRLNAPLVARAAHRLGPSPSRRVPGAFPSRRQLGRTAHPGRDGLNCRTAAAISTMPLLLRRPRATPVRS